MKALAIALAMTVSGTSIEQKIEACAPIASVARDVMATYQAGIPAEEIFKTCKKVYGEPSKNLCALMTADAMAVDVAPWEEQKVALVDLFQKRWLRKCVNQISEKEKQQ